MMIPGDKISLPRRRGKRVGAEGGEETAWKYALPPPIDLREEGGAAMFRRKPGNSASKQAVMRVTK